LHLLHDLLKRQLVTALRLSERGQSAIRSPDVLSLTLQGQDGGRYVLMSARNGHGLMHQLSFHADPRQARALIIGRFRDHATNRTPIVLTDAVPVLGGSLDVGSLSQRAESFLVRVARQVHGRTETSQSSGEQRSDPAESADPKQRPKISPMIGAPLA